MSAIHAETQTDSYETSHPPPDGFDQLHSQYNVTGLLQLLHKAENGEVASSLIYKLYEIGRDQQAELRAYRGRMVTASSPTVWTQ